MNRTRPCGRDLPGVGAVLDLLQGFDLGVGPAVAHFPVGAHRVGLLKGHEQARHNGVVEHLILIRCDVVVGNMQSEHVREDALGRLGVAREDRGVKRFNGAATHLHPPHKSVPPDQADLQVRDAQPPGT